MNNLARVAAPGEKKIGAGCGEFLRAVKGGSVWKDDAEWAAGKVIQPGSALIYPTVPSEISHQSRLPLSKAKPAGLHDLVKPIFEEYRVSDCSGYNPLYIL